MFNLYLLSYDDMNLFKQGIGILQFVRHHADETQSITTI